MPKKEYLDDLESDSDDDFIPAAKKKKPVKPKKKLLAETQSAKKQSKSAVKDAPRQTKTSKEKAELDQAIQLSLQDVASKEPSPDQVPQDASKELNQVFLEEAKEPSTSQILPQEAANELSQEDRSSDGMYSPLPASQPLSLHNSPGPSEPPKPSSRNRIESDEDEPAPTSATPLQSLKSDEEKPAAKAPPTPATPLFRGWKPPRTLDPRLWGVKDISVEFGDDGGAGGLGSTGLYQATRFLESVRDPRKRVTDSRNVVA